MKINQKDIRELVNRGIAEDITNLGFEEAEKLRKSAHLETIGISHGTYGMNGAILQSRNSGKLYAITARNSTLFQLV